MYGKLGKLSVVGVALILGSWALAVAQVQPLVGVRRVAFQPYYLVGNLKDIRGKVITDRGSQEVEFSGAIGFQVATGQKGELIMSLVRLNLLVKGASTTKGDSGLIGLMLAEPAFRMDYDPRTGAVAGELGQTLHYALIDRIKGYRRREVKGENDLFVPYTEQVVGKLLGRLPEALEPADKGNVPFEAEVALELSSSVLGLVRRVWLVIRIPLEWLRAPAEALRIQPVFIGSGPTDPNRTGNAFTELINRSHELWNRCGSVRCIKFVVNAPIYVNNASYRVLDSSAEATNLRAEVDVANAVEVFVVQRMSTTLACSWGGGACFSSGTASAKIVTCDQQLAVPCPCPSACTGYCPCGSCLCGAVNPFHLAHELGHAPNLDHPSGAYGLAPSTATSIMEPSGFCCDNPDVQSAKNCRNAANPLLFWTTGRCIGSPDISD